MKVARKTGLTIQTIYRARDGFRVHKQTAELISAATGGEVAVDDMPHVKVGAERDEEAEREPRRVA